MALHRDFPNDPHAILDPAIRWFPADESLRDTSMEKEAKARYDKEIALHKKDMEREKETYERLKKKYG